MNLQTISGISILGMFFALAVSIGIPVALLLYLYIRKRAKLTSFFIGAGVFFVMAMVLEQTLHVAVLSAVQEELTGNIWAFAAYGGLAAALFEETGRYIAMRYLMKKNLDTENALMYGAGHGGFEAILIVGMANINNIVMSIMINTGGMESTLTALDEEVREVTIQQLSVLWTTPDYVFYLAGVERLCAIVLQIALSILMYCGVRYGRKVYVALAFGIHFLVDFITVLSADYMELVLVEGIVIVLTVLTAALTYRIWKGEAAK